MTLGMSPVLSPAAGSSARASSDDYSATPDEQQHDGCGVPVLRRGHRREGSSGPGAGGRARGAAQLQDLPGYLRGQDGVLVVERPKARIVQAFKRRDRGVSLVEIQALLAANGIQRSISGVAPIRTPASRAPRCRRHPAGRARRRRTRAMTARLRREGSTVLVAGRAITRPRAATPMTRSLAGTVSSASAALNGRPLPQILLIPAGLRARFPRIPRLRTSRR
jgi:hypothetical protein